MFKTEEGDNKESKKIISLLEPLKMMKKKKKNHLKIKTM